MSYPILTLLWKVIAHTSGSGYQFNSVIYGIDCALPDLMYFFEVIVGDVPELDAFKYPLAVILFLENNKKKFGWCEVVI